MNLKLAQRRTAPSIPDHELLHRIGQGSYGEVWLARNVMGVYRAVKIVHRDAFESDRPYEREYRGIRKFEPISRRHESQVDILHVGRNDEGGYFYYVMELADDSNAELTLTRPSNTHSHRMHRMGEGRGEGDPATYVPRTLGSEMKRRGRLPFNECLEIALSLTTALQHLHDHGLIHRDIKPANIIFVEGLPKLADIGLVAETGETLTFVGTEGYLPPEGPGSVPADIFSLGKVLYELCTGKDRLEFPEMPTGIDLLPEKGSLFEFNEVLLKACEPDLAKRYQTVAQMHEDLLLLKAGKSVRRSHLLERRVALLTKLSGFGVMLTILVLAGYFYQQHEMQKANRLAAELQLTHGFRVMEEGDLADSLLWFVQALEQARWSKEEIQMHRFRLGAVLRHCPKLVQLISHDSGPGRVEFSPDGRRLITFFGTTNVQVSDVATGQALAVLRHTNTVWHAAISADGERVVTATENEARVWDIRTGRPIGPPIRPGAPHVITANGEGASQIWNALAGSALGPNLNHATRVAFSRDGRSVITASAGTTVQVWNPDSGELNEPAFAPQNGYLLAVSPDGTSVLTASGKTAYLWNTQTGERLLSLEHSGGNVIHAKFSSAGDKILAIGYPGSYEIWDAATGQAAPPRENLYDADLSPDGEWAVVGGEDGLAQVFEATTGRLITSPLRHNGTVWGVRFDPTGRYLATANAQQLVRVWDIASGQFARPIARHTNCLSWAGFSPDGERILTASWDGTARLWDGKLGKPLMPPLEHRGFFGYGYPSFSRNGECLLTATAEDVIQLWDVATGKPVAPALEHRATVHHAEFSPDRKRVVTTTVKGDVQLWNLDTAEPMKPTIPKLMSHAFASFSPDGRRLATIGSVTSNRLQAQAQVWDVTTGRPLTPTMTINAPPSYSVSFNPDGNRILTRSHHSQVRVWDAQTGQPITPVLTHNGSPILAACFSPDGRHVLTAGGDRTARLWDSGTGKPIARPLEHKLPVKHAAFSPDGRRVVTASDDHTARIWDAGTGLPLTPPLLHRGAVSYAEFSPDGQRILTACDDGTARVWEFEAVSWPVADLRLLAELLSGRTIDAIGSFSVLAPEALIERLTKLKLKHPDYFRDFPPP